MGCADSVELFRPGTTIHLPFLVTADSTIVDITDGTVTAIVEPLGQMEILLSVGSGIEIDDPAPIVAPPGGDQAPHGYITLTPEQTEGLPLGQLTELKIFYLTPDGVKTYTPTIWLRGE